jgi:hypothetical protein
MYLRYSTVSELRARPYPNPPPFRIMGPSTSLFGARCVALDIVAASIARLHHHGSQPKIRPAHQTARTMAVPKSQTTPVRENDAAPMATTATTARMSIAFM